MRKSVVLLAGGASISTATFSGQSLFADGTVTAPSISFTADTTTGFHRVSTGAISYAAAGTDSMNLGSNLLMKSTSFIGWSVGNPTSQGADTTFFRGNPATVYLGDASATDNTGILGDATHRLNNVHTKALTIGQSLSNPTIGQVTLSGGTGTASVQTTALSSGDRIFLTHQNAAGTTGTARVTSSTAGTGFTIVSSSSTDTSVIGWMIVKVS